MQRSCFRKSERVYHPIYGAGTVTAPSNNDVLVAFDQLPEHQLEVAEPGQKSAVWVPVDELTILHGPSGLMAGEVVQVPLEIKNKYVVIRPPTPQEVKNATPKSPAMVRTARLNFPDQPSHVGTIALLPLRELERTTVSPDEVIEFVLNVKAALKRGPRPVLFEAYGSRDKFYSLINQPDFNAVLPVLVSEFRSEAVKC